MRGELTRRATPDVVHHAPHITCVTHLKVFRANNSVAVVCFGRHVIIKFACVPAVDSQSTDQASYTKN